MSKKLLFIYIPFVLYSVISFLFPLSNEIDLVALMQFEGDVLISMIFSMLGVFPMLYLVILFSYKRQPFYVYILFLMGYMLGGFVLIPALILLKTDSKKQHKTIQLLSIILPIILTLMLIFGIILGDLNTYIEAFSTNRFVHIMTIDFLVLVLTPYVLGFYGLPFINYTKLLK